MRRFLKWLLVPAAVVAALALTQPREAEAQWRRAYRYYPAPVAVYRAPYYSSYYAPYHSSYYAPYYAPRVGVYVGPPAVGVEVYRPGVIVPGPFIPPPPPPPVFWW